MIRVIFFIVIALALPAFALINLLNSQFKNDTDKIVWTIIILIIPIVGSLLYFAMSNKHKL